MRETNTTTEPAVAAAAYDCTIMAVANGLQTTPTGQMGCAIAHNTTPTMHHPLKDDHTTEVGRGCAFTDGAA